MIKQAFKKFLPDHRVPMRIWRGPFRGARIWMNPRHSLRKIFGLYEYELNQWLEQALHRVERVLDVGANDGYFTFGCAAAFRRLRKTGEIFAFEPQDAAYAQLIASERLRLNSGSSGNVKITIRRFLVGSVEGEESTTLDALMRELPAAQGERTLIKIDVEGAELDVIKGARSWLQPSNLFVIEVHQEQFLPELKQIFAESGHSLMQINQRPVPFLGREDRDEKNWWLVSNLQRMGNALEK
jgi:hypothetical protein